MKMKDAAFTVMMFGSFVAAGTVALAAPELGHKVLLGRYKAHAPDGFSAARGKALFETKTGEKSCTGCHTSDIRKDGRAQFLFITKTIAPMALSVNPKRFSKPDEADRDFDKYCKQVLGRICTDREKGDLLTYFTLSEADLVRLLATR